MSRAARRLRPAPSLPRVVAVARGVLASRGWLASVVTLGVALRIAHVLALRRTPWFTHLVVDPEYYDAWARRIAAGAWLGDQPFYMDPLYPYVLAVLYRTLGRDLLLARLLNVACSAAACVCVAHLGRRVGGPAIGGLAALGLALYLPDVFNVGEIDKTSLSILLSAAFLALALGETLRARLGAGIALGLAALTRANFLVFVPLTAVALLRDPAARGARVGGVPRALVTAAVFVAGVAGALAPVAWHNHHVSGTWVLTTAQAGQNFYTGNNPANPYGAYGAVPFVRANPHFEQHDFRIAAEERAGRPLEADAVSRFWFREALAHMRADPGFAARALARKLLLFWNDFEIADSQDQYLVARDSWVLRLPLPGFGAVAPLALLGIVAGVRRRRPVRLLTGFALVYCGTVVAFFLFARYRIPVVPALLPLAALGVRELVLRACAGDARRLLAAAVVLVATALFTFQTIGLFARDHPRVVEMRLRHLADLYLRVDDPGRAIAALREAIPYCTHGCPWALKDLFDVYERTGRLDEGVAFFEDFIRAYPAQRDAPGYLASLRAAAAR